MPSLSEFRALQQRQAPARRGVLQAEREAQAFVALRIEDLLADDGWGVFRKHLEVLKAHHKTAQQVAADQILGDAVGEDLMKRKLEHARLLGLVAGLDLALSLPEQLQAQASAIEANLARELDNTDERR